MNSINFRRKLHVVLFGVVALFALATSGGAFAKASPDVATGAEKAAGGEVSEAEGRFVETVDGFLAADGPAQLRALGEAAAFPFRVFELFVNRLVVKGEEAVVVEALRVLQAFPWPRSEEKLTKRIALIGKAGKSEHSAVRAQAILALSSYPFPTARKELSALRKKAGDETKALIDEAQKNFSSQQSVEKYMKWLAASGPEEHEIPAEWKLAQKTMLLCQQPQKFTPTHFKHFAGIHPDRVRHLLLLMLTHTPSKVSTKAYSLLRMAAPLRTESLTPLLTYKNAQTRAHAAGLLRSHTSPHLAQLFLNRIGVDKNPTVRKLLRKALARQPHTSLTPLMERAFLKAGPKKKGKATSKSTRLLKALLGKLPGDEFIWPLALGGHLWPEAGFQKTLSSLDPDHRRAVLIEKPGDETLTEWARVAALKSLRELYTPELYEPIAELLAPPTSPKIMLTAATILQTEPDKQVLPLLERALKGALKPRTAGAKNRLVVYKVLQARNSEAARRILLDAIKEEPTSGLKIFIMKHQKGLLHPAFVPAITRALTEEKKESVRLTALDALSGVLDPTLPQVYHTLLRTPGTPQLLATKTLSRLSALPPDTSNPIWTKLAANKSAPLSARISAVQNLEKNQHQLSEPMLEGLLTEDNEPLRRAARDALHSLRPDVHMDYDGYGRVPLIGAAAGLGATLLGLTTEIADNQQKKSLLTAGGAILGGSTAYLLTLRTDVSLGQASYFAMAGAWGTIGGYSLARVAKLGKKDRSLPLWSAVAGDIIGGIVGSYGIKTTRYSKFDLLLSNGVAASWGMGALALTYLSRPVSTGWISVGDLFFAGGMLAAMPLMALSPKLKVDSDVVLMTAAFTGYGSWLGALLPYALNEPNRREAGDTLAGIGVGQALGVSLGLGVGQFVKPNPAFLGWTTLGMFTGAGLGAGAGLRFKPIGERSPYALAELGNIVGAAALAAGSSRLKLSVSDKAIVGWGTTLGTLLAADQLNNMGHLFGVNGIPKSTLVKDEILGERLMGAALGFYGTLALSQFVELTPKKFALATAGGMAMGGLAGGMTLLANSIPNHAFSKLVLSTSALGFGGLALVAPKLRYSLNDSRLGGSALAWGGVLGNFLPAYWTGNKKAMDPAERNGGILLGASLGYLGAFATSQWKDIKSHHVIAANVAGTAGGALGLGLGLLVPSFERRDTTGLSQLGVLGGYALGVWKAKESRPLSPPEALHLSLSMVRGGWHGSQIPSVWRKTKEVQNRSFPEEEITGGVLLGVGLGAVSGALYKAPHHQNFEDVIEVGLWDAFFSLSGYAVSIKEPASLRDEYRSHFGMGLTGWVLGEVLAPRFSYSGAERSMVAMLGGYGALLGQSLPLFLDINSIPTGDQRFSGATAGLGLFGVGAMTLAQLSNYTSSDLLEVNLGALAGALVGGGLRLTRSDSENPRVERDTIAGIGAGLALGLLAAPHTTYSTDDRGWMLSMGTLGTWLGWNASVSSKPEVHSAEARAGAVMAGTSLGMVAAAAGTQGFERPWEDAAEASFLAGVAGTISTGAKWMKWYNNDTDANLYQSLAALGGYGAGVLLSPLTEFRLQEHITLGLGGMMGAAIGRTASSGWMNIPRPEAAMTLGTGIGTAVGYGVSQVLPMDARDHMEFTAAYGTAALGGLGLGVLRNRNNESLARHLSVGQAIGIGLGLGAGNFTTYDINDRHLIGLTSLVGGAQGLLLPFLLHKKPTVKQGFGGGTFGAALGATVGAAASQFMEISADDFGEVTLATLAGDLMAGGAGLMLERTPKETAAAMEAMGFLGFGAGLHFFKKTNFSKADRVFTSLSTVVGGAQGLFLPFLLKNNPTTRQIMGGGTFGAALGASAGAAASQLFDVTTEDFGELTLTMVAGDLMGAGAGFMLERTHRETALAMEAVGLLGLGVGTAFFKDTTFSKADRALIGMTAAAGGAQGFFLPYLLSNAPSARQAIGGVTFGAAFGASAGAAATQLLDITADDIGELTLTTLAGDLLGAGAGLLLERTPQETATAMGAMGLLGFGTGAYFFKHTTFSSDDTPLLTLTTLMGMLHGGALPFLLTPRPSAKQALGGVVFGTALGASVGAVASQFFDLTGADVWEVGLTTLSSSLIGAGTGLMLERTSKETAATVEAMGLLGFGAGMYLTKKTTFSHTDKLLLGFGAGLGLSHGVMLAQLVAATDSRGPRPGSPARQQGGGALLGTGLGVVGAMVAANQLELEEADLGEMLLTTLVGDTLGLGLAGMFELEGPAFWGTIEAAGVGMSLLSVWASQNTTYSLNDTLLLTHGLSMGGLFGALTPVLWDKEATFNPSGFLAGAATGVLAWGAASQFVEYSKADIGEIALGSTLSSVAGAGLGLLLSDENAAAVGLMQTAGLLGTVYFGAVAPGMSMEGDDWMVGSLLSLYGVYQGLGLTMLFDAKDRQVGGGLLFAGALGALGGGFLASHLDITTTDAWILLAGSAWGVWLGGWTTAVLAENGVENAWGPMGMGVGTSAVATNLTLGLTFLGLSQFANMPPEQFGWISLGGGAGMVFGTAIAGLLPNAFSLKAGVLYGSIAGLVLGTAATSLVEFEPLAPESVALTDSSEGRSKYPWLPRVLALVPSVQMGPGVADRMPDPRDADRMLITLTGFYE